MAPMSEAQKAILQALFNAIDQDGNGLLDKAELLKAFSFVPEQVEGAVAELMLADLNGDGKLSFEEVQTSLEQDLDADGNLVVYGPDHTPTTCNSSLTTSREREWKSTPPADEFEIKASHIGLVL